jgi:hypothetical protein
MKGKTWFLFLSLIVGLFACTGESKMHRMIPPNNLKNELPGEDINPTKNVNFEVSITNFPTELIGVWSINTESYKAYGGDFSIEKNEFGYELYYQRGRGNIIDIHKSDKRDKTYLIHCFSNGSGQGIEIIEFKLILNGDQLKLYDLYGTEQVLIKMSDS